MSRAAQQRREWRDWMAFVAAMISIVAMVAVTPATGAPTRSTTPDTSAPAPPPAPPPAPVVADATPTPHGDSPDPADAPTTQAGSSGIERVADAAAARVWNVLWLGNSYTFWHDVPHMVEQLAAATNGRHEIRIRTVAHGGATIRSHWERGTPLVQLQRETFDALILQGQSMEPLDLPAHYGENIQADFWDYSKRFGDAVMERQAAGQPTALIFFVTWARRTGHEFYTEAWTGGDPRTMQAWLNASYQRAAEPSNATLAMVGNAWQAAQMADPAFDPFDDDGSHPNLFGSYLAACVVFETLVNETAEGLSYRPAGITDAEAQWLQRIASATVAATASPPQTAPATGTVTTPTPNNAQAAEAPPIPGEIE